MVAMAIEISQSEPLYNEAENIYHKELMCAIFKLKRYQFLICIYYADELHYQDVFHSNIN